MYLFDTNTFYSLSNFYPKRFPTIWKKIDELTSEGKIYSVKEVFRELNDNCPSPYILKWAKDHRKIFIIPNKEELSFVGELMKIEEYRGLIKQKNILNGKPVADPFLIAVGKVRRAIIITLEKDSGGARIPSICKKQNIDCKDLEYFMVKENIIY